MRKLLLAGTVLAISAGAAHASTVSGTFNAVGTANFNPAGSPTQITFVNPANSLVDTGDLASFSGCVGCVTMTTPLTVNPFTPGVVYSATLGGLTTTFDATSSVSTQIGPHTLAVVDSGIVSLTGFDSGPGLLALTVNEVTQRIAGSMSLTSAVPEPASLVLFGTGLVVLGMTYRRRRA